MSQTSKFTATFHGGPLDGHTRTWKGKSGCPAHVTQPVRCRDDVIEAHFYKQSGKKALSWAGMAVWDSYRQEPLEYHPTRTDLAHVLFPDGYERLKAFQVAFEELCEAFDVQLDVWGYEYDGWWRTTGARCDLDFNDFGPDA